MVFLGPVFEHVLLMSTIRANVLALIKCFHQSNNLCCRLAQLEEDFLSLLVNLSHLLNLLALLRWISLVYADRINP